VLSSQFAWAVIVRMWRTVASGFSVSGLPVQPSVAVSSRRAGLSFEVTRKATVRVGGSRVWRFGLSRPGPFGIAAK
jgi:hypothetical protein